MNNPISIVGTIATDPKLITTQSGVTLCSFRVASGDRRFDRAQQKWVDGETNWFGVTAFRALAEHAHESFRKGERIVITGRLRVRRWETGEKSGLNVEIEADALGHDLRWGVSRFEKRSVTDSRTESAGREDAGTTEGTAPAALPSQSGAFGDGGPESWHGGAATGSDSDSDSDSDADSGGETGEEMSADGFLPRAA